MRESLIHRELMVRYLLNDLSQEEEYQIEECYFTNSAFLRELLAARNELISTYVQGTMNDRDLILFEKLLQTSAAMREKVDSFRGFLRSIDATDFGAAGPVTPRARPAPAPAKIIPMPSSTRWRLPGRAPMQAAAGILLILTGAWFGARQLNQPVSPSTASTESPVSTHSTESRSFDAGQADADLAAKPPTQPSADIFPAESKLDPRTVQTATTPVPAKVGRGSNDTAKTTAMTEKAGQSGPSIKIFFLTAGNLRGETGYTSIDLKIPSHTDIVRLYLDVEENLAPRYMAELQTQQGLPRVIWKQKNLSVKGRVSNAVVVCDLPVKKLESGRFLLRLRSQVNEEPIEQAYTLNLILPASDH